MKSNTRVKMMNVFFLFSFFNLDGNEYLLTLDRSLTVYLLCCCDNKEKTIPLDISCLLRAHHKKFKKAFIIDFLQDIVIIKGLFY